jgi:Flp pilus assembly protein TadD
LGAILALFDFEWEAAEREMARARELNPSSPVVLWHSAYVVQQATGRLDEAEALMQRAIELDPLSPLLHSTSSVIYGFRHDFDRAIRHLRQTIELDPNYWHAHYVLGLMYGRSKRAREAAASLQWADELSGGNPFARGALAWAHIVAGQEREGRTILTQITAADVPYKPPYSILMPLIALGETETALDCLERAVDARDPCLISVLKNSPLFDPLRSHPRFQTQLRRAGLA